MTVTTRAEWERLRKLAPALFDEAEEHVIERNANWLIQHLYDPAEHGMVCSERTSALGMDDEAINWGDLHAFVEKRGEGVFDVVIEEAAPDCSALPEYIRGWLARWGWDVKVATEW